MLEFLQMSSKKILSIMWMAGSLALGFGLAWFPWQSKGTPFVFMVISSVLFGVSMLNLLVFNNEPERVLSEPWSRLIVVYFSWGGTLFLMQFLPLWLGGVMFVLMISVMICVSVPIIRRAYYKTRR